MTAAVQSVEAPCVVARRVEMRVYGEPQPQGNKTGFTVNGRVVMTEGRRPASRDAFKDWRGGVSAAAKQWQAEHGGLLPIDEPCGVQVVFWLTKPSSLPKWRWLPWARPDIDKLVRAVLDGITGTIIRDDGRVFQLVVTKLFALDQAPGCSITVQALGQWERGASGSERGCANLGRVLWGAA